MFGKDSKWQEKEDTLFDFLGILTKKVSEKLKKKAYKYLKLLFPTSERMVFQLQKLCQKQLPGKSLQCVTD